MDGVAVCAAVTDSNLSASGMATAADTTRTLYAGHSLGRALEAAGFEAAGFEVLSSPKPQPSAG
ncbi:MAG: hypothetical protein VB876_12080 [Pirellulales bacterium]